MTNKERPAHASLIGLPAEDDEFIFAGEKISTIAKRVGKTPFYAYDSSKLTKRLEFLRKALPRFVHLHYAVKANPMPAVVKHMAELVDGLDVASAGELAIAMDTGIDPTNISFAGPGKTPSELSRAVEAGIIVNIESELELQRLVEIGDRLGRQPHIAIRVNPDFELKTSGMKMSGGPKQFGIDAEQVPAILKSLPTLNIDFYGFHIFSGSQNLKPEAICEAQTKTVRLAAELAEHAPNAVRLLNIGGGFGIPYFPGEKPLELDLITANLLDLAPTISDHFPSAEVVIELGRYLVGEAGIYVCQVNDRKISRGQVFLVTDGGLHHHLAASGNFGQVIRKNYPVFVGNKVQGSEREVVSVVGPLCTPLDLLAERMEMASAQIGDLIVVMQSGAYGLTASPTAFLSHPEPAEVLL